VEGRGAEIILVSIAHSIAIIFLYQISFLLRIRVRICPPHPHVRRKRRLNGAVPRMRPEKPRSCVSAGVQDKDPSLLKGLKRRA
jgi:hypothetical protein